MSGSLYVITTEECNMNCPFCYTKFVPDFKDTNEESHINENMATSIINIGNIINKTKYDRIIFHGGEPLLYPKTINNIINNVKYDSEYSIQTNLNFDLTSDQIDLLFRIGSFGTSYSYDRFFNKPEEFKRFKHNIKFLVSLGLTGSLLVTLTEQHMENCNPFALKDIVDELGIQSVIVERTIYPIDEIDKYHDKYQDLYNKMDLYMLQCAKIFPKRKTNLFNDMATSILNKTPFMPIHCSEDTFTLYNDKLKYGCPSKEKNIDNKKFMIKEKCLECYYYPYCQGDCECINHICAFPVKLCDFVEHCLNKK